MTQDAKKSMMMDQTEDSGFMYYNGQYSDVVVPIQVDLNDIFEDLVTITISKYVKVGSKIAVKIGTCVKMHSVTGVVESIKETVLGYEAVVAVDFIPDGLLDDLEEILAIGKILQEDPWG